MNIYAFDGLLYRGHCAGDFYRFCLRKHPSLLRWLPLHLWVLSKYLFGFLDQSQLLYEIFRHVPHPEEMAQSFWSQRKHRLSPRRFAPGDAILSSAPLWLLRPAMDALSAPAAVALEQPLPVGAQLHAAPPDLSLIGRAKAMFLNRTFVVFLFIGCVNTLNSTLFAFALSHAMGVNAAFVVGYLLSLSISYWLNAKLAFKQPLAFPAFLKFCLSYLPNFAIQNLFVLLLYNGLGLPKLLTYGLSAVIGIPVTFVALKLFAFASRKS